MLTQTAPLPTDATSTPRQRWLYSLMNLGMTITAQATSFLLLYYVDDRKLNPNWAANMLTIYALYNAINNPLIGYLSDRTRSRWGRRIPYIRFGFLPQLIVFVLLFMAPFDGQNSPVALLVYYTALLVLLDTFGSAVGMGYFSLLPEMFRTYQERADVAMRMNMVQTVGLLIGLALPPLLARVLGWGGMAICFAVVAAGAILLGLPGLREHPETQEQQGLPFGEALRATFGNRSFLTVVAAQTMRFVATGTLATGMGFYIKYSLGVDDGGLTTAMLATAFITAGIALYPWRKFVASRFEARTTLMLAFATTALAILPLAFVTTVVGALVTAVLIGIGLAGMILVGDIILGDVIDEDELKTGQRREGMYFGLSGLITTLSGIVTARAFGWVSNTYGYDPTLATQPASVAEGFRVFMTVPSIIGAVLALALLFFYPLHGERLVAVRRALAERRG